MANINNLVTINDYVLPPPSTYEGLTTTIVDTSRNAEGKIIGQVVRDDIAKISLTWRYLSVEDWSKVNKLFTLSLGGSFTNSVTFFDQVRGEFITREMYISDRSAGLFKCHPVTGEVEGWLNCKFNLVEV